MLFKPSIKKLVIEKGTPEDFNRTFSGDKTARPLIEEHMLSSNAEIWLARCGKKIIGSAYVFKKLDDSDAADGENTGYISNLYVEERYRNQGVGSKIVNRINERLGELGFKASTLGVHESEKNNVRLYKKLGYTEHVKNCALDLVVVNGKGEHKPMKEYMLLKRRFEQNLH